MVYICEMVKMAKAGFFFLVMAVVIPLIMAKTGKYDRWHFPIACVMYVLAIFGIAMMWAEM